MSKRNKKKQRLAKATREAARSVKTAHPTRERPQRPPLDSQWLLALAVVLVPMTIWAYWPTFVWMEDQWRHEPDYSHGYIVIPLALSLLYFRRDLCPVRAPSISWAGVWLLCLAIGLRILGRLAYMDFLDGWSLVPWVAGLVWIFAGWRTLYWAAPAVIFLLLLVPMPYRAESLLSYKLQGIATMLSAAALQTLGLPAIAEGHTIWLDEQQLMVEEACSGLRIFVGMAALGFYFAVLARRSWLDKVVILVAAVPIALIVNSVRVTGTGLAYHWLQDSNAKLAHDLLGVVMILLGAALLAGVKRYWESLYRPLEISMLQKQLAQN